MQCKVRVCSANRNLKQAPSTDHAQELRDSTITKKVRNACQSETARSTLHHTHNNGDNGLLQSKEKGLQQERESGAVKWDNCLDEVVRA